MSCRTNNGAARNRKQADYLHPITLTYAILLWELANQIATRSMLARTIFPSQSTLSAHVHVVVYGMWNRQNVNSTKWNRKGQI